MTQHERWMTRAIDLARRGLGRTSPNPPVGAVIVRDGRVVGEGYHARAGLEHAEQVALRMAGEKALGATLYVTLEPCNHVGQTPPCTDAVIAAGLSEVHFAVRDPNEAVPGGGFHRLTEAGIRVFPDTGAEAAADVARFWLHAVTSGRPYVIAKYAASLDGKIASSAGTSRWITGEAARTAAHAIRAESDAILVGAGTAIADDPDLSVRLESFDGSQPWRVVLDSTGRVPLDRRLFRNGGNRTIVATTGRMPAAHRLALEALGVSVLELRNDADSRVSPDDLLEALRARGVVALLVEGGSDVLGTFFDRSLVDEVAVFLAPIVLGGRQTPSAVGGSGVPSLARAHRLTRATMEPLDDDWLVRGRVSHSNRGE